MNKRVLLGMSGGVDSSVAALILQKEGFDVTGITFLFSELKQKNYNSINQVKEISKYLNIKHLVVDLTREFRKEVINYFVREYELGRTPFPCAYCNPNVKFHYLEKIANVEKCTFISTGHYAQIKRRNKINYVYQGKDPNKDQSFFLWGLKRDILNQIIFPLGPYNKTKIREIAEENGFPKLARKKDSMGICFIEGNNYRKFLKKEGIISMPGNFVDHDGNILGQHSGIYNYTIGQRRGLGLNLKFPVFVSEIRLNENEIVLAEFEDLYRKKLIIKNYYFVDKQELIKDKIWTVKIRYRLQLSPCKIYILNNQRAEVELLKPESMIAHGQTAVFYDNDRLIGGGFIEQSF